MLDEKERQIRNDKLNRIINELAESQEVFSDKKKYNDYYMKLSAIYKIPDSANFVHSHNEIFSLLAELDSNNRSLDILGQNVRMIYEYCINKRDPELLESVFQLYDHINLDIARLNYIKAVDRRLDSTGQNLMVEIEQTRKAADDVKKITDNLKTTVDDMSGKVNNAYSEFVSILGIFSAIVLVFFGGTSIFGNIISNMDKTYIYKSIIMCVLTGIVVFDIVFMLIYFMAKILNRSIAAISEPVYWHPLAVRFRERYPFVFFINYFGFLLIYVCCAISIWINIKNNYSQEIIKILTNVIHTGIYRSMVVATLLFILLAFNIAFVLAYIVSKITDLDIGRTINTKYRKTYDIIVTDDGYTLLVDYDIENITSFRSEMHAKIIKRFLEIKSSIAAVIYNFFSRVLLRYPYYTCGNIIIIAIIYLVIYYKEIIV